MHNFTIEWWLYDRESYLWLTSLTIQALGDTHQYFLNPSHDNWWNSWFRARGKQAFGREITRSTSYRTRDWKDIEGYPWALVVDTQVLSIDVDTHENDRKEMMISAISFLVHIWKMLANKKSLRFFLETIFDCPTSPPPSVFKTSKNK